MESTKETLPKKRVAPAAHRDSSAGYSGISLSPPVQKKQNETGLPDQLKEGAESLSGYSMDDVNVHYNSPKPAQLNAHAYAQGTDIHLGPGQEKHLPHEAWHVVQQKQRRVKPSNRLNGKPINDSPHLEKEADRMGEKSLTISSTVQAKKVNSSAPIPMAIQRAPGDEPLLRFLEEQSIQARDGFVLMGHQTEVALEQVDRLENLVLSDELSRHPNILQIQMNVADAATQLRGQIPQSQGAVQGDHDTVVARANAATIATPSDVLGAWTIEAVDQVYRIGMEQAKISGLLANLRDESVRLAGIAMTVKEIDIMKDVLTVADTIDAELENGNKIIGRLNGLGSGSSSLKEELSLYTAITDSVNNATTGIGFGVVGALDAGNVFSLSANLSSGFGIAGGALGILFGAIGTFLGVKNAILGGTKKSRLTKAKSKLSNDNMDEITDYAIHQKNKKIAHNVAGSVGGLIAISAGIVGLIALTAGTLGTAAIVLGLTAAVIGLGFVGFKIVRKWWKRRSEKKQFADELISQINENGDEAAGARNLVASVGLNPDNADQPKFRKKLAGKVGDIVTSKRTDMAEGLVKALIDGKPSEKFDAEIILTALGIDAGKIKRHVNDGNVGEAVGKVAKKLASW